MISFSKPEYVEALKLLWRETFGDSERYIKSFFDGVYDAQNTLVYIEDGRVVSSLYMIPYKMRIDGSEKSIIYLYALATDPIYRGKKIMSSLIQKSFEISAERNYVLSVLVPAEDSLADFYRQFGFEYSFNKVKSFKSIEVIKEEAKGQTPIRFTRATAKEIWSIYINSVFSAEECIILSEEQNEFYINELEKEGGEALLLNTNDKEYYALLMQVQDEIVIYESNLDSSVIKPFYASLIDKYEFKTVTFHEPICFSVEETNQFKRPFAMSKSINAISLTRPFINRVLT